LLQVFSEQDRRTCGRCPADESALRHRSPEVGLQATTQDGLRETRTSSRPGFMKVARATFAQETSVVHVKSAVCVGLLLPARTGLKQESRRPVGDSMTLVLRGTLPMLSEDRASRRPSSGSVRELVGRGTVS
jgi:hypothetical protein